jgi:single-strand DNA-binding protein
VEKTEWHSISAFGPLAKICGEYLKKGSQVFIEGKLSTRKWQDKDTGKDRYKTEIICSNMQMLGSKPREGDAGQGTSAGGAPRQQQRTQPSHQSGGGHGDDFDEDIPF